jgi:imidazolonepropionase-like amidohydrolase/ketosteroid isomerase-like protein
MLPLILVAALASARPLAAQVADNAPLEIYHGFTLIDGTGGPPVEDAAISVRGNSIVTVGSRRELLSGPSAPRDAIVINLGGGYVIPGMIDAHVHLSTSPDRQNAEAELYRLLYSGVTAVRDMAGDARALASLARDSRLGEIVAPDVHFSAVMAGPSFMSDARAVASTVGETPGQVPWMQAITPQTDVVTAVARARGTYATGVKIYANLAASEVQRISAEAHLQGIKVWAHSMVFPARPLEVVEAGVDVISHACYLAWEAMAQVPDQYRHNIVPQYGAFNADSQVFTELFDAMRQRGTMLDATLATYTRPEAERSPDAQCDPAFASALVRRASREGIPVVAGSDFTTPPDEPFPALYTELETLVSNGGLTPMQAIVTATSAAARAIGIEATAGTLGHGRPVDFVFMRRNPLEDIGALRSVEAVWKNAVRYDRDGYRSRFRAEGEIVRARAPGADSPTDLMDQWLAMWRRYDLDRVRDLFLDDDALTYFPSDREGLITGIDAVLAYHEELGFAPGGFEPDDELWLEDVTVANLGESAVIGAIWHFGSQVNPAGAGRGPLTMVLLRTAAGFRISHVGFGNYTGEPRHVDR